MSDSPSNEQKINIEVDEKTADGTYSNLAIINHSISEFIIDFIALMPGAPKAKVKSRIILTPEHAKRLLCTDSRWIIIWSVIITSCHYSIPLK